MDCYGNRSVPCIASGRNVTFDLFFHDDDRHHADDDDDDEDDEDEDADPG